MPTYRGASFRLTPVTEFGIETVPDFTDAVLTVFEGKLGSRRVIWGSGYRAKCLIRKGWDESGYLAVPLVRQVLSP
jgi:hypothetical protein